MAKKTIIWSNRANQELIDVLDYFNKRNKSTLYSHKILLELEELLDTLSSNIFIGRLASDKQTRVLVMKKYLIFYEVNNEIINILSFWDNRQDLKKRIF